MQRRTFISRTGTVGLLILLSPAEAFSGVQENSSDLEQSFRQPPATAYPQVLWFWVNGHISKEGITLDLEAMKDVGISGVFNYDVGADIPKGPVAYLSKEWLQLKTHAIAEAERLGLEFTMHNCPGWSASGGPWITPDMAMQQITWSEAYITGKGQIISIRLAKPLHQLNCYRDIAVLAFPSLQGEAPLQQLLHSATASNGSVDVAQLTSAEAQGITVSPAAGNASSWLQLKFKEVYEARFITFFISGVAKEGEPYDPDEKTAVLLEASDDGIRFTTVTAINTGLQSALRAGNKYITYDIPPTKARYFRLTADGARRYARLLFSGVTRLQNFMEKAGYRFMFTGDGISGLFGVSGQEVPATSIINKNDMVDLTAHMGSDDVLIWKAPRGNWTVLRIGFSPTGTPNRAAPDGGEGLECDKFNREAFDVHFSKMMEHLGPLLQPLAQKGKAGLEIDSYEAGMQNWTPHMLQEFQKRRGYDLLSYLPAMTGRVVGSVDRTDRFLWDFRRTMADLIADNYYGRFAERCHQHGFTAYVQPYDRGPMEEMQVGAKADVVMGEFWNGLFSLLQNNLPIRRTPKLAASISHINHKKIAGAEAFTSEPESGRWQEYPFALKPYGDAAFTKGINQLIIHRFVHQPHPTAAPGLTLGPYGMHFDRTNTWWKESGIWLLYLARCQSLLQQGTAVADLLYFTGEEACLYTKVARHELQPTPPQGYDYDVINAESILQKIRIENNTIVLPGGMRYRLLVLQDFKALTVELLLKIRELVAQGMLVVGARPLHSLGLDNDADGDAKFVETAAELWGHVNGTTVTENRYGKGLVYWNASLLPLLQKLNLKPDVEITSRSGTGGISYSHRKIGETHVYFMTNAQREYADTVCTFRIPNRQPERWDAVTGHMVPLSVYDLVDDRVRLPIPFEPYGSLFIVFRQPASAHRLKAIEKDGAALLHSQPFSARSRKLYGDVVNNFTIAFWAKPEINAMLRTSVYMGHLKNPWTDGYAIYPPSGNDLYGPGHATSGIAVGRNGVGIWEHGEGQPVLVLAVAAALSGWEHIALVYEEGVPLVYVNGVLLQKGKRSGAMVHPELGESPLPEGASYYNGDSSRPQLFRQVLRESEIIQLASERPVEKPYIPVVSQTTYKGKPALLMAEKGRYTVQYATGKKLSFDMPSLKSPLEIDGPWGVSFPPHLGAPSSIVLSKLISLHLHPEDGVKYFSGTATYTKNFTLSADSITGNQRLFLNLGSVEVLATVTVNQIPFHTLWKRPYEVDITEAVRAGTNRLVIRVTNLWPNRLVGDEQGAAATKSHMGTSADSTDDPAGSALSAFPDWYVQGRPKPEDGRVAFASWKHYTKSSPLLQSGLIGPVVLYAMAVKAI